MARVFGSHRITGIDVQTPSGTRSYNADKRTGLIEIDNKRDLKQALSEGMAIASEFSAVKAKGFPCSCGFNAIFRICGKCGKDNG